MVLPFMYTLQEANVLTRFFKLNLTISSLSIRYNSNREVNMGIRLDNWDSSSPLSDGVGFDFLVNELDIVQTWNCLSYGKMSIVRSRVYPCIRSLKQSHSVPPCFIVQPNFHDWLASTTLIVRLGATSHAGSRFRLPTSNNPA